MTISGFAPTVPEEQAWDIVLSKAPGLRPVSATLRHHPFSGFVHRKRGPESGGPQADRMHTLVDRLTGSAFITEPWPPLGVVDSSDPATQVSDPLWNTIGFEEARRRAVQVIRTALLRRAPLAGRMSVEEVEDHELLWKPNWLLSATLGGRQLRVLVDALNGGYYVVGS